jgi:hypothetical protein
MEGEKMRRFSYFPLLIIFVLLFVQAEAADFEHRENSIRFRGMGDASVAFDAGIGSINSNPAGIANQNKKELYLTHQDLFGIGFYYNNFAYALPTRGGALGLAYERLENSVDLEYKVSSLQVGYGWQTAKLPLSYGVNVKTSKLDSVGGTAEVASLGMGILGKKGNISWGVSAFNLLTMAKPAGKVESAPLEVKMGLAYAKNNGIVAIELNNEQELRLGAEYKLSEALALRCGLKDGAPAFGLGLNNGLWSFDYSFDLGSVGNTHSLGLTKQF